MVTSSNVSRRWLSRVASRRAKHPEAARSGRVGRFLAPVAAVACLWAVSCSSSTTHTDNFIGDWTFGSGSSITGTNCMGLSTVSLQGEKLTLAKGTTSDLVSTLQSSSFGTCTLNLNESGTVASAATGQKCTFTVAAIGGLMITFDVTAWTVTTSDGVSMTTAATATGEGLATGCTIMLTGAGTHASGTDASAGG